MISYIINADDIKHKITTNCYDKTFEDNILIDKKFIYTNEIIKHTSLINHKIIDHIIEYADCVTKIKTNYSMYSEHVYDGSTKIHITLSTKNYRIKYHTNYHKTGISCSNVSPSICIFYSIPINWWTVSLSY